MSWATEIPRSINVGSALKEGWDQTKELLYRSLGSRPTQAQGHFPLAPLPFLTTAHYLSVQTPHLHLHVTFLHSTFTCYIFTFHIYIFQLESSGNISKHTTSWLGISPIHTTAHLMLMLLLCGLCCWTLIRLPHHGAWPRQRCWPYRHFDLIWSDLNNFTLTNGYPLELGLACLSSRPVPFFKRSGIEG